MSDQEFSENEPAVVTLRRLTEEAREAPLPELDWDGVEAKLFDSLDVDVNDERSPLLDPAADSTGPRGSRWLPWGVGAAVAVAAAAALFVGLPTQKAPGSDAPQPVAQAGSSLSIGGAGLALRQEVRSRGRAIVVKHDGRAQWTLAPASRARVVSRGRFLTVELLEGSLTAEVTPRPNEPEHFAVEVDQSRIAVRGTRFVVTRTGDGTDVTVDKGVVAVGPSGTPGATDGWLLTAPASATFSSDGSQARRLSGGVVQSKVATVEVDDTKVRPRKAASGAPPKARVPSVAAPAVQAELTRSQVLERVASSAQQCFVKHTPKRDGMQISVETSVGLTFLESGKLGALAFDPPLAPAVQACVSSASRSLSVSKSDSKSRASRRVVLGR